MYTMRKIAALLLALVELSFAATLQIAGVEVDVNEPDGWYYFQETANDHYFARLAGEELVGLINFYAGGEIGMSNDDLLEGYDGDTAALLGDLHNSLVETIEGASGEHGLAFGDYSEVGTVPAFFAGVEYTDSYDDNHFYNLDTMYLHEGQIFFVDAYCVRDEEVAFRSAVTSFLDSIDF